MLPLNSDFFYPDIYDAADEHIINVTVKVFARSSILIMAVVDNGPQLDSYKFENQSLCKSFKHIALQVQDIHGINVLWIVVLQQLII